MKHYLRFHKIHESFFMQCTFVYYYEAQNIIVSDVFNGMRSSR